MPVKLSKRVPLAAALFAAAAFQCGAANADTRSAVACRLLGGQRYDLNEERNARADSVSWILTRFRGMRML